jgi:riboflavin synthase
MFTGIVPCTGRVTAIEPGPAATRLTVEPGGPLDGETRPPRLGDSIALAGVCLTVAELDGRSLRFDLVPETLRCTKLGRLAVGDRVNLEPAVAPHQPLGGHFMQGHVDALAQVLDLASAGEETRLSIALSEALRDYVTPKGSIAIDGVSLTVAAVRDDRFEIALIPTTLEHTTLGELAAGDAVNIETDMITRAVVQWLGNHPAAAPNAGAEDTSGAGVESAPLSRRTLEDAGFADMS